MNTLYLAAPIFTEEQLKVVHNIHMSATMIEYEVFSPYHASREVWKGRAPKDCTPEERQQVLQQNIDKLEWAEILMCWVGGTDNGKTDTGVVWEMGHFNALQKRPEDGDPKKFCLAYIDPTDKRQDMNLMLAGTVDAVVYGPAQLHKALTELKTGLGWVPQGNPESVRQQFSPDKLLRHESEAIS